MRVVGVGGDPAKQSHAVECDALAGEDEQEGEEGGAGVAVVEGVEEADVEEGACGPGGQREGPGGVLGALGEAGVEAGAGVRGDAVAFSSTPTSPRWRRTSPDRADDNPLTACRSPYQHRARDTFWDQGDDFQGSDLVRGVDLPRGRASSRCPALRASTSTRRGGPCGARRAAPVVRTSASTALGKTSRRRRPARRSQSFPGRPRSSSWRAGAPPFHRRTLPVARARKCALACSCAPGRTGYRAVQGAHMMAAALSRSGGREALPEAGRRST